MCRFLVKQYWIPVPMNLEERGQKVECTCLNKKTKQNNKLLSKQFTHRPQLRDEMLIFVVKISEGRGILYWCFQTKGN